MRLWLTTIAACLTLHHLSIPGAAAQPRVRQAKDISLIGAPSLPGMLAVTLSRGTSETIRFLDLENRRVLHFAAPLAKVGHPSFSPDGESIAFVGTTRKGDEVFTSAWQGGDVRRITFNSLNHGHPSWSAEGDAILHFSEKSHCKSEIFSTRIAEPFTRKQLTNVGGCNRTPLASPDNRYLLYVTDRYSPAWNICLIDSSTKRESCPFRAGNSSNCRAAWSPDGTQFVFTLQRGDRFNLYLYTVSTNTKRKLTSLPHKAYDSTWSPDGRFIAFAHDASGQGTYEIKALRLSDKKIIPVAKAAGSLRYLSWTTARPYTVAADLCPQDPLKTKPDFCGCGTQDVDSDNDTIPDCIDGCPNNPKKHNALSCK